MVLGYVLSGNSSNNGIFFDGDVPAGVLCPNCGTCQDSSYVPSSINVHPSMKYDISYTHDLRELFSERFVKFCIETLRTDDEFYRVKCNKFDLFYLFPKRILEFDSDRRKTRFEKKCPKCGGYESIVGARPAYLKNKTPIGPGFHRSDIPFGSGKSKFPLLFISTEWKERLETQRFRGIEFEKILA